MSMTTAQVKKADDWIQARCPGLKCSACSSPTRMYGEIINGNAVPPPGGAQIGGEGVAMLQVICANCGHIDLFAARMMRLP